MKSFYAAPAFEDSPSPVTLTRGAIFVNSGSTANGQTVSNNYIYLTEVLTDGDWLISTPIRDEQGNLVECPCGYRKNGSIVSNTLYDHKGNFYSSERWAVLCGTNKNVLLAVTCPEGYISRGSVDTTGYPLQNVYEYDVANDRYNAVGGQVIHLCVKSEETYQSNKPIFLLGDFNEDERINSKDVKILLQEYSAQKYEFDLNFDGKVNNIDTGVNVCKIR